MPDVPIGRTLTHRADGVPKSAEELLEAYFSQADPNARAQLDSAVNVANTRAVVTAAAELHAAFADAAALGAAAADGLRQSIDRAAEASGRHERQLVFATVALVVATAFLAGATVVLALR